MALEAAPTSWTDALKVLPARERLAWQRVITADVAAQGAMPKQGPRSRAYVSGAQSSASTLASTLRPEPASSASSRAFPSTADFLASTISEAFEKAKVPLPATFEMLPDSAAGASDPLVATIRAASLDTGYRLVIAKALQRRLAADPEWTAEAVTPAVATIDASASATGTCAQRFAALASIADGSLVSAAAAAAAAPASGSSEASAGVGGGGAASGPALQQGEDALLDAAMAELLTT